jgi:hypothetical protein
VQNDWEQAKREYIAAMAYGQPADIRAGIGDIHDALKQKPDVQALKDALKLLERK